MDRAERFASAAKLAVRWVACLRSGLDGVIRNLTTGEIVELNASSSTVCLPKNG